jgi:hypothetical protein
MFEDLITPKDEKTDIEEPALFMCPYAVEFQDQCDHFSQASKTGIVACADYGLLTGYCYNERCNHEIEILT